MKLKKTVCGALAVLTMLTTSAVAKDNIYAYNKFISTVLGPQVGYCDITASFKGHESEYENVNDYYAGLISAYYEDIDDDRDNELITVDMLHGVTVYRMAENGVVFLGSVDFEMIENYGDSYTNVFDIPVNAKKYIGVERYDKTVNSYNMAFYELNAGEDELNKILEIKRVDNEDGKEESVWALNKTYYSATSGGGFMTAMNEDGYADCVDAAVTAIRGIAPDAGLTRDVMESRINGSIEIGKSRLSTKGIKLRTYARAIGIRFSEDPVVYFEDDSNLMELMVKPKIVTVMIDGKTVQFPTQDPMIVEDRTLVPMRTIFEALGADVQWIDDGTTQSIVATTADTMINMTINSDKYTVNGEEKTLDVPAQLINDKTLVPIRAISESLGCVVGWDDASRTVVIQSNTGVMQ